MGFLAQGWSIVVSLLDYLLWVALATLLTLIHANTMVIKGATCAHLAFGAGFMSPQHVHSKKVFLLAVFLLYLTDLGFIGAFDTAFIIPAAVSYWFGPTFVSFLNWITLPVVSIGLHVWMHCILRKESDATNEQIKLVSTAQATITNGNPALYGQLSVALKMHQKQIEIWKKAKRLTVQSLMTTFLSAMAVVVCYWFTGARLPPLQFLYLLVTALWNFVYQVPARFMMALQAWNAGALQ